MLAVIKSVVDNNIICLSATQLMHAPVSYMVCATQFNSCCAKPPTSFFLSYGPNGPELNSINYEIYGVYISYNISFKSTKLKKSSSNWLNSGKAVIRQWSKKDAISCFRVLPGSAEALVR